MLSDADWYWLMPTDADWCWFVLTDADWCRMMLLDADLFWPLLRARMGVLTNFFCKMYFLCVSQSRKKSWATFFLVLPPERAVFSRRGSLAVQISREVVLPAQEPPLWKSAAQHFWWAEHKLWSSVWLSRFPERGFWWQRNPIHHCTLHWQEEEHFSSKNNVFFVFWFVFVQTVFVVVYLCLCLSFCHVVLLLFFPPHPDGGAATF